MPGSTTDCKLLIIFLIRDSIVKKVFACLLIERGRKKKELRESELDESKVQRKVNPIPLNGEYLTVSQMAEICSCEADKEMDSERRY